MTFERTQERQKNMTYPKKTQLSFHTNYHCIYIPIALFRIIFLITKQKQFHFFKFKINFFACKKHWKKIKLSVIIIHLLHSHRIIGNLWWKIYKKVFKFDESVISSIIHINLLLQYNISLCCVGFPFFY